MKLHLPNPCSLDGLPSPTNKWSASTHPIKGWVVGYLGYHISYKHFYRGNPKGSTELDAAMGHNCAMTADEYTLFALLVLGLRPGKQHGTGRSERSFLNMLLENFVKISNLTAVLALNEPADQCALARTLACFSLLLLGVDALTPRIITRVWGQNEVVCCNLGGPFRDLALICRQLILLACVANNTFHLWLTTTFNGGTIIPDEAL
jgi:hypothetical protein